jgi:diguanylate cyclase (GGDEF)-like protein/PAS domain S-box-containing protein
VRAMGRMLLFILLLLLSLWGIASPRPFHAAELSSVSYQPTVLIINSYNKGLTWTDDQTEGITHALGGSGIAPTITVEYLDWKNNPTQENLQLFYQLMKAKYAKKHIDLLMATDDAALEFALRHRDEIFSAAPVVFSGVYPPAADRLTYGYTNATGFYENIDAEGTLRLMVSLNPDLKEIYLLFDNSESGLATKVPVEVAARQVKPDIAVYPLNDLDAGEITRKLSGLPADAAVLVTTYSSDPNGNTRDIDRYVKLFAASSKAPVYVLYDFLLGGGAVGGSVISGRRQGEEAARLGRRIIAGEPAAAIPIIDLQTGQTVVDYQELQKHRLPVGKVPPGGSFLNRPLSYYEEHKRAIWMLGTAFCLMAVYIVSLTINIRRRRRAEAELKKTNADLAATYEVVLASQKELTEQYQALVAAQRALQESEERHILSLSGANDGLWDWNIVSDEVFFSERCTEMLGLDNPKLSGLENYLRSTVPPADRDRVLKNLHNHLQGKTPYYSCEHRLKTPSGTKWILARGKALFDETGRPVRMAGSLTDIAERKRNEEAINYLAYHDALTGMANRLALNEKLRAVLAGGRTGRQAGAVAFIDLDNFKVINDTFGHSHGDRLLVTFSCMLQQLDGGRHFIARIGGDEFVILVEGVTGTNELTAFANKIVTICDKPLTVEGKTLYITASIGITVFPADGATVEELFKNADLAMYKAKDLGKNRYVFFDKSISEVVLHKTAIERNLREAVTGQEFELWYQPIISVATGRITGLEALIRWHRDNTIIMPGEFIKIAEETGLILAIGNWALTSACDFAASLLRGGHQGFTVTVNLSAVQLMRSDFADWVRQTVLAAGLPPATIGLEITESVLIESFEANIGKLAELRDLGVKIYLDDFGTGYSSLKYLQHLPVDVVKIDKSFTAGLTADLAESDFIGPIIALARQAGLQVVAEGVETEYQYGKLIKYNCDFVQGYFFSKPVPAEKVPELLVDAR